MCPVGVFVATVAPGVAPPVEGEAAGVRHPGLLPPQQPALAAQGAASARVTVALSPVTECASGLSIYCHVR